MQTLEQLYSGELAGLRHLKLSCGLSSLPRQVLELADTLEILDLSGNALSSLPDALASLRKLRIIFCSNNAFTELPEVLGSCPALSMVGFKANRIRKVSAKALPSKLRWLILTDNHIETLPPEIGDCDQLQKLMLAGNKLQALPASLANCKNLELLRIAANQLSELPTWLFSLPKLSWLAYSGNPFNAELEEKALTNSGINEISWHHLELEQLLGEGASGHIHSAKYRHVDDIDVRVAVKLFKGAVTSDGLPHCEMAASISAGQHPHLINVHGRVTAHPTGADGLVMELIDAALKNLAQPPSLESCTRDVYPADVNFELPVALQIARSISSAALHLHQQGIMHGDLYGHNILHCGQGRALIGDFGAASFYATDDDIADSLERLEVRAFGCLLEELIDRCRVGPENNAVLNLLRDLQSACLSEIPEQRPLFAAINELLHQAISKLNS